MYLSSLGTGKKSGHAECHLTVDRACNGWGGHVGVVGSLFKKPGVSVPVEDTIAFVCGPPIMFRFVIPTCWRWVRGTEHRLDTRALHEMRRRQVRALLHRHRLHLRGRPGVHVRANQETRGGHLMPACSNNSGAVSRAASACWASATRIAAMTPSACAWRKP